MNLAIVKEIQKADAYVAKTVNVWRKDPENVAAMDEMVEAINAFCARMGVSARVARAQVHDSAPAADSSPVETKKKK